VIGQQDLNIGRTSALQRRGSDERESHVLEPRVEHVPSRDEPDC
jgi:hypothetical protein